MPFSLWDYLRERTRDAVLAGFQDALDIVEQDDTEASQHATARRLSAKLAGSLNQMETPTVIEATSGHASPLPHASINGHVVANGQHATNGKAAPSSPPRATVTPPQSPPVASTFDDEMESRLSRAAAESGQQTPQSAGLTNRRPRGRPKKSEGSK